MVLELKNVLGGAVIGSPEHATAGSRTSLILFFLSGDRKIFYAMKMDPETWHPEFAVRASMPQWPPGRGTLSFVPTVPKSIEIPALCRQTLQPHDTLTSDCTEARPSTYEWQSSVCCSKNLSQSGQAGVDSPIYDSR